MSKFSRFLGSSKPIKLEFSRWLQIRMLGSKLYPTKRFTKIIKILNFFNFQNSIFNQTRRCSLWHYHIELGGFEIQDSPKNRTFRTIVNDLTTEPNYNLLEFSVFFRLFSAPGQSLTMTLPSKWSQENRKSVDIFTEKSEFSTKKWSKSPFVTNSSIHFFSETNGDRQERTSINKKFLNSDRARARGSLFKRVFEVSSRNFRLTSLGR